MEFLNVNHWKSSEGFWICDKDIAKPTAERRQFTNSTQTRHLSQSYSEKQYEWGDSTKAKKIASPA